MPDVLVEREIMLRRFHYVSKRTVPTAGRPDAQRRAADLRLSLEASCCHPGAGHHGEGTWLSRRTRSSIASSPGPALHSTPRRVLRTARLFWNSGCGVVKRMLPDPRAWEADPPAGAPTRLVVSAGSTEANRDVGLRVPIGLDDEFAVGRQFGTTGTPSVVRGDAQGRPASQVVVGAPGVRGLAGVWDASGRA
jgi:hypothetical protein